MRKKTRNIIIIILAFFALWMLFIDSNSLLIHRELNDDISDLEDEKEYYKNEIEKDNKAIDELSTDEGVEKLAREKYYMKKDNEDIYIIEYEDSLKIKKKDE